MIGDSEQRQLVHVEVTLNSVETCFQVGRTALNSWFPVDRIDTDSEMFLLAFPLIVVVPIRIAWTSFLFF